MRRLAPIPCLLLLGACNGATSVPQDAAEADSGEPPMDSGEPAVDAAGPGDSGPPDTGAPDTAVACSYPEGAVEPMALGAVLWPYRWPEAILGDGTRVHLDLEEVHCTADENIDWSPFDILLFISIAAW